MYICVKEMLNYMKKATGIGSVVNQEIISMCKVDPGYIQPDDGVLAAKLLVVSSTIYLLLSMGDDNIENEKEEYIGLELDENNYDSNNEDTTLALQNVDDVDNDSMRSSNEEEEEAREDDHLRSSG